jgi:hypothetical protein
MTIALIAFFVIAVCVAGYLLWKSRDTWRWFHITASAITLLLSITMLFPTAGVLKSRSAWNKVKEDLDARLARVEAEQQVLKYGDPLDPAAGRGVLDMQSELRGYALEAGRRWQSLRMQAGGPGSITLTSVAPQPELPPGVTPEEPAPAADPAADPAAAAAAPPQPLVPQGLIVYGFAEAAEPGLSVTVPSFFLGEFRVTASAPGQVTLAPANTLEPPQQQAIASGQAQTWTLYEMLPLDGHVPFIAPGSEPADDAVFGRVDDVLVKRLLGQGVSQATIDEYLRDGSRAKQDDPPSTRWVKIEFTKAHNIVVDSPEKRNVLDGGFFDGTGQAVDSRLQRGEDGTAKFKVGDQIVVKEEAATELIDLGVAKLLDTYFVRELHDYRFVLRRIRLRISELAIRQTELEYQAKVLQDAIAATVAMLGVNQDIKLKLEKDVAKIAQERQAIDSYKTKLVQDVATTKQRLVGLYRSNLELAAELRKIHKDIEATLP